MEKPSHRLYYRYEYLAMIYASKLFNFNSIGMERKDIVQELKMKIYTSIISYGRKWGEYKKTGRYKPIPLLFYLQTALNNKLKDMMRKISNEVGMNGVSIQRNNFDGGYSTFGDLTKIDFKNKDIVVRGVDLLEGLGRYESNVFCLFLKGYPIRTISKAFSKMDVNGVIKGQISRLEQEQETLLSDDSELQYSYSFNQN